MFEIPIWNLLYSFTWDTQELEFSWEVLPWFYDDLEFLSPLSMKIKLISLDDGITVVIEKLDTKVKYENEEKEISLSNVDREFKLEHSIENPDDIKYINQKNMSLDLKDIIREEILISCID